MPPANKRTRTRGENLEDKKQLKTGPAVGDKCPDFELETDQSQANSVQKISLKEMVKDNGVVLFFYPRANTPGCTQQACSFRDNTEEIERAGYKIYGMSGDRPRRQSTWKKKQKLDYCLLSDPSHKVLEQLGVISSRSKIVRSLMVIEKGGVIKSIQIGVTPKASVGEAWKGIREKAAPPPQEVKSSQEQEVEVGEEKEAPLTDEANVPDQAEVVETPTPDSGVVANEDEPEGHMNDGHDPAGVVEGPAVEKEGDSDEPADEPMNDDVAPASEDADAVEGFEGNIPEVKGLNELSPMSFNPDTENNLEHTPEDAPDAHVASEKAQENEGDSASRVQAQVMVNGSAS